MSMEDAPQQEMNLEEVALQYGDSHRAAREYIRLAHAVRGLKECRWWQVFRKHNIRNILIDTIRKIDADRPSDSKIRGFQ